LNRVDFMEALRRIAILVEQKSRRTFLTLNNGEMVVSSEEGEIGTAREEIACDYEGAEVTLALNYKYLEEPLKVMDTEKVTISFTEPNRAITVNAEPPKDYFHIIMPMQIE